MALPKDMAEGQAWELGDKKENFIGSARLALPIRSLSNDVRYA